MSPIVIFARINLPSQISRVVGLWREDLRKTNEKAAKTTVRIN